MAQLYGNPQITGVERPFAADDIIVTKTDSAGRLTYANRTFYAISGYEEGECIGQQHNIVRHPEMPRSIFQLLWETIAGGAEIFAYVNNRAKNGDNYWVLAHVTPSFDSNGQIIGYHSNRRAPRRDVLDQHIIPLYRGLLEAEKSTESPKDGLLRARHAIDDCLLASDGNVNKFLFSLGV